MAPGVDVVEGVFWDLGYGNLENVGRAYHAVFPLLLEIKFTLGASESVYLDQFEIAAWSGFVNYGDVEVQYTINGTPSAAFTAPFSGHETVLVDYLGAQGQEVVLGLRFPEEGWGVGVDNIQYSFVPLPPAIWPFASALGVFGYLGKRITKQSGFGGGCYWLTAVLNLSLGGRCQPVARVTAGDSIQSQSGGKRPALNVRPRTMPVLVVRNHLTMPVRQSLSCHSRCRLFGAQRVPVSSLIKV